MKTNTQNKPAARSVTWGTSHFESLFAARAYYRAYFGNGKEREKLAQYVAAKLNAGEIHLGPPTLKPGQTLFLHREERRYFITETAAS